MRRPRISHQQIIKVPMVNEQTLRRPWTIHAPILFINFSRGSLVGTNHLKMHLLGFHKRFFLATEQGPKPFAYIYIYIGDHITQLFLVLVLYNSPWNKDPYVHHHRVFHGSRHVRVWNFTLLNDSSPMIRWWPLVSSVVGETSATWWERSTACCGTLWPCWGGNVFSVRWIYSPIPNTQWYGIYGCFRK